MGCCGRLYRCLQTLLFRRRKKAKDEDSSSAGQSEQVELLVADEDDGFDRSSYRDKVDDEEKAAAYVLPSSDSDTSSYYDDDEEEDDGEQGEDDLDDYRDVVDSTPSYITDILGSDNEGDDGAAAGGDGGGDDEDEDEDEDEDDLGGSSDEEKDEALWLLWHPLSPEEFVDSRRDTFTTIVGAAGLDSARCQALSVSERTKRHITAYTNFLYGECDFDLFTRVFLRLKHIHGALRDDHAWREGGGGGGVFLDLGSGAGKVVLAAALLHAFDTSVGIECLRGLHNASKALGASWTEWMSKHDPVQLRARRRRRRLRRRQEEDGGESGGKGGDGEEEEEEEDGGEDGQDGEEAIPPHGRTRLEMIKAGIHDELGAARGGGGGDGGFGGDGGAAAAAASSGADGVGGRDEEGAAEASGTRKKTKAKVPPVMRWCSRADIVFVNATFFDAWLMGHVERKLFHARPGTFLIMMAKPLGRSAARVPHQQQRLQRPAAPPPASSFEGWELLEAVPYTASWGEVMMYSYKRKRPAGRGW